MATLAEVNRALKKAGLKPLVSASEKAVAAAWMQIEKASGFLDDAANMLDDLEIA